MEILVEQLNDFVMPTDALRMVLMQPFVADNMSEHEVYKLIDEAKQIAAIQKTLEIAKATEFGINKTHFTIFPEYSIPGINGVNFIQSYVENAKENWPSNSIIIGGIDGLEKAEYVQLLNHSRVSSLNSASHIPEDRWVNCCIIWVKINGTVTRYIQPKIIPAWLEKRALYQYMHNGQSIYLFEAKDTNGTSFRFSTLVCADWMEQRQERQEISILLDAIHSTFTAEPDPKRLHIVFVIKHNPNPNDQLFLNPVHHLFENALYNKIDRDNCLLIFANTATGKLGEKGKYGFSTIIAHPNAPYYLDNQCCPPTYAVITHLLRSNTLLGRCKEALFRENGPCIHSCKVLIPYYRGHQATDKSFIIDEAHVHSIEDTNTDPRAPGGIVPASVKWVNDELENIPTPHTEPGITTEVTAKLRVILDEIKWSRGDHLQELVNMGTNRLNFRPDAQMEREKNVDLWDSIESESLWTIIKSLLVLSCNNWEIKIKDVPFHATIITKNAAGEINAFIDIIIVMSANNSQEHEKNLEYLKTYVRSIKPPRKVLIISRSDNDYSAIEREKKVTEVTQTARNYSQVVSCLEATDQRDLNLRVSNLIQN